MRIDPIIQRELDALTVPYTIHKTKDHYMAFIAEFPPVVIGGNHDRHRTRLVKHTVQSLRKIRKQIEGVGI